MVLRVSNPNNVKIYTVSGSGTCSIPDWLARQRKRVLKDDPEWQSRVELIQDFEFPEASIRIKTTKDGRFVMATGVYKPQIRVFEYAEMSMKFSRHTDSENVNFLALSDDWTKTVFLQNDRTIEFHSQNLAYHYPTCDLLLAASSNEVYRLNLNQGKFLNSIETNSPSGVNVSVINPVHQLFGFGTEDGTLEFWDPRSKTRVGLLAPKLPSHITTTNDDGVGGNEQQKNNGFSVTAMEYRTDGLSLAVGISTGHVLLYDLRASRPWLVKDHQYGYPIKNLKWYDDVIGDKGRNKVISADCKIMKIWDAEDVIGTNFTSVEPNTDINDICIIPETGLIFVANEGIQIGAYYIPALGPAPKWCSFLDNLTEELEENPQQNIYDDYKFVTRKELEKLGMEHLIGTNILRPYMHGFFVDLRLYEKAKSIANPFAYSEYREQIIKQKLEKERESRIRVTKKLPKGENLLEDGRFKELFINPDFEKKKKEIIN
nr:4793_t:CDS:10 [Entrophospora candida]